MFDFFLQVDLASVNRKKRFTGVEEEADKEEEKEEDGFQLISSSAENNKELVPSFINTHLGATMQDNAAEENQKDEVVKEFLKT